LSYTRVTFSPHCDDWNYSLPDTCLLHVPLDHACRHTTAWLSATSNIYRFFSAPTFRSDLHGREA